MLIMSSRYRNSFVKRVPELDTAIGVQGIGHHVQPIAEQVPVLVERHHGRLVAQHLLDHLDIGAAGDGQAGRGALQLMRRQPRDAEQLTSLVERTTLKHRVTDGRAADATENQIIGRPATWRASSSSRPSLTA